MNGRIALSFAVAALILAGGGFLALLRRIDALAARPAAEAPPAGRPPGVVPPERPRGGPGEASEDPLLSDDPVVLLRHAIHRLQQLSDDQYEYYTDVSQDLFALKREVRQLKGTLRQVVQGLGRGRGTGLGIGWGLLPAGSPLDGETVRHYREEAEKAGVRVEEGRVTVRGFLNLSPRADMPIEFFMTRFPESGHETLVHLIGNHDLETLSENPYDALKGLATALYKGLVAAGFREGLPTHPDPDSDPKSPRWILATGDPVYLGVRYERGGATHMALATDWVLDPVSGSVLPPDAFRFTGSVRGEDPDTGDAILGSEALGLVVSVWPSSAAMVEVALESALRNDYAYHHARIPKPDGQGPLYLDIVFSKTPIEPQGDGAEPLERPPPIGPGPRPVAPSGLGPGGDEADDEGDDGGR